MLFNVLFCYQNLQYVIGCLDGKVTDGHRFEFVANHNFRFDVVIRCHNLERRC
ncbi:MAG: hypothetical protein ACJA2R_000793 [Saprospiraceae bacterium]